VPDSRKRGSAARDGPNACVLFCMNKFTADDLKRLWKPRRDSSGEDNGQITIIGGSSLFHGAPVFALRAASRLVDMVFFSSPEPAVGEVAAKIRASVSAFVWVPWHEIDEYIAKSEAVLVGPGFMSFGSEKTPGEMRRIHCDDECRKTRDNTKRLLEKFLNKKWVIDGGSLQVMDAEWIPKGAILTPNAKEFEMLFNEQFTMENLQLLARKHECVIVYKGPVAYVTDGKELIEISGGNAGLTKGGTGDTLAGVIVGLVAKNDPLLAACAGSFLVKKTADWLYEKVGYNFSADDLAESVFGVWKAFES
jgi:ADP-dependent NAD(P)H-hydrate dehydratase / NAD(P)H-hydrate epimerase